MFTFIKNILAKPQLIKIDVGEFVKVPMGEYSGGSTNRRRCNLYYDDNTTKYRELSIDEIADLQFKIIKF